MRKIVAFLLAFLLAAAPALAGLSSDKAQFVGGTLTGIKPGTIGSPDTSNPKAFAFVYGKHDSDRWSVPYAEVTAIDYGQHAGRRVGATVALGVTTLGLMALPMLLSKKRRHYLTIEFKDASGGQAAIFQVGKGEICSVLTVLEARTGEKIQYEDAEAKKSGCE